MSFLANVSPDNFRLLTARLIGKPDLTDAESRLAEHVMSKITSVPVPALHISGIRRIRGKQ